MLVELFRMRPRVLAWAPLLALLGVTEASSQQREIVSKQVAVARDEASLRLEFASGDPLEVSLTAGVIRVNGRELGSSTPELEGAWRFLLGQAVALEDGPLARALVEWSPPDELEGEALETASRVDEALERALTVPLLAEAEIGGAPRDEERAVVARLLGRRERLVGLAEALEDLRLRDVRLHVGEEVVVAEDTEVRATVVVVDGNLEVHGEVDGDVVVVGGSVRLHAGGRITGDVRLADARLYRDGGAVEGEVRDVEVGEADLVDSEIRERIRSELRREIRDELRDVRRAPERGTRSFLGPFRSLAQGVAGVLANLLTVLVLGVAGGVLLYFGGKNLEVVAETARRAPARAAAVGLAGTFLALPVWLLGAVALAISIIGIPVVLIWLPLFPVAVVLAAGLGYYAVAHNVGAWIARRRYPYLTWVRVSNPYTLMVGGVLGLMGAFIVANLVEIGGPWLGFLEGLFVTVGVLATVLAVLVGFGAVLITRAGRRPEYYTGIDTFDGDWEDDLGSAAPSTAPGDGPGGGGAADIGSAAGPAGAAKDDEIDTEEET